jgi:hypothetical protein
MHQLCAPVIVLIALSTPKILVSMPDTAFGIEFRAAGVTLSFIRADRWGSLWFILPGKYPVRFIPLWRGCSLDISLLIFFIKLTHGADGHNRKLRFEALKCDRAPA